MSLDVTHSINCRVKRADVKDSLAHLFFGENTIPVTLSVSLSRWFARLWPRHAKQIRKIALEWVPRAQNHDWEERRDMRTFATIKSLPLLESLVITVDEQKILRKMFQDPDVPVKWHGSLGAGPQMYVHMSEPQACLVCCP